MLISYKLPLASASGTYIENSSLALAKSPNMFNRLGFSIKTYSAKAKKHRGICPPAKAGGNL